MLAQLHREAVKRAGTKFAPFFPAFVTFAIRGQVTLKNPLTWQAWLEHVLSGRKLEQISFKTCREIEFPELLDSIQEYQ